MTAPTDELSRELRPPLTAEAAVVEADRCLECGGGDARAPCRVGCPAGIDVPSFVAQAASTHWHDLSVKVEHAVESDGPALLNVLTDCPVGWGHDPQLTRHVIDAAVETRFWPLYEVVDGRYRLTYRPGDAPVEDWLGSQQRFAHLFRPENAHLIRQIQDQVDSEWVELLARCHEAPE